MRIDTSEDGPASKTANRLQYRYSVTASLALVCVLLFVLRYAWGEGGDSEHLLRMGANHGTLVKGGEWYRLLASAFLHGDPLHLFANMLALAAFGPMLEALLGPRRYLVLYGASALAGSLASAFLSAPRSSVGASGAVWGLMTAGIALVYRPQGLLPEALLGPARQRAWAPLAINLMYSFKPGVDFLAHIGGGLVGAGLVLSGLVVRGLRPIGPYSRRGTRSESLVWTLLSVVTGLALAGSIAFAFVHGKPWEAGKPPELVRVDVADTGVWLTLPDVIKEPTKDEKGEITSSYLYGDTDVGPLLVEVSVTQLQDAVAPEALENELKEVQKVLDETPEKATRVAAPTMDTIASRLVIKDEIKLDTGVAVRRYALIEGKRFVVVRFYEIADVPKSWAGVEQKVVASIAAK